MAFPLLEFSIKKKLISVRKIPVYFFILFFHFNFVSIFDSLFDPQSPEFFFGFRDMKRFVFDFEVLLIASFVFFKRKCGGFDRSV